jgi:glycosyltransferase involved in cell wall biosynthesis
MKKNIAYLVSRFPKLTETFILYEMQALEALGARLDLFPLVRQREKVIHPEAESWIRRAHYRAWYAPRLALSQLYWLVRSPRTTLAVWWEILAGYGLKPKRLLRTLYTLGLAFDFARQMRRMGTGHIHAHWATNPATAAYIIQRLTGIPYSFTAHAHDLYVDQTMLAKKMDQAAFVVTISEYNRQVLRRLTGKEHIAVVHCGVDTDLFTPPARRENETFTIVTVAALEEKKGHRYLVEALQKVAAEGIALRCLLVGEGPLRQTLLQQIHEAGLQERVTLTGGLPRQEVLSLLRSADVMVLPSIRLESGKQEGIPVALMEGMAMELPVIASRISGVPELVDDGVNGLLVPEKDAQALAAAILVLARDSECRRRLGENARQKVLREFDQVASARSLLGLIEQTQQLGTGTEASPLLYGGEAGVPIRSKTERKAAQ